MSRQDPGAAKGNREYPIQRGPCVTCGHGEISHMFDAKRWSRRRCSVMDPDDGTCACLRYEEPDGPTSATAEEKLRRIWELHTDSVAGVCPSCGRIGEQADADDGVGCLAVPDDPGDRTGRGATKYGPVRRG